MNSLRQDVRFALAVMRRSPGFTVTACVTLALGVGATTAALAIVQGVLLLPLPYAAPGQLVRIWEERPPGVSPAGNRWLSRGAYLAWQPQSRTLDALGGYGLIDSHVRLGAVPAKMAGARVSALVLGTLGVAPASGRLFTGDDDRAGAAPVVIISDRLARERSGSSADAPGAALVIDGIAHTIVGVMPASCAFPEPGPCPRHLGSHHARRRHCAGRRAGPTVRARRYGRRTTRCRPIDGRGPPRCSCAAAPRHAPRARGGLRRDPDRGRDPARPQLRTPDGRGPWLYGRRCADRNRGAPGPRR